MITKEIISLINTKIQNGKSNKEIAECLDISYNTVRNIGNQLSQGICETSIIKKKGRICNHDNVIGSQLLGIIGSNNALTQRGMVEELSNFGTHRSQATISRILSRNEITRKRLVKVPEERNCPRVITLRQQYAQQIQHYSNEKIVYLDETGFNIHTTQNYGYSCKNTKAYVTVPASRGQNVSLMAAISVNSLIGWELIKGAYNGQSFNEFITKHLIPYFSQNQQSILVMDNCRFHHRKDILQLLNQNRLAYKFLPPYTPDLNPIENFFGEIKAKYRAISPHPKTNEELKEGINGIMQSHEGNFLLMFEHAKGLLPKALAGQPFI